MINVNDILSSVVGYSMVEEEYQELYRSLSLRGQRVLDRFFRQADDLRDYYKELLLMERKQLQGINGCGRVTEKELCQFLVEFRAKVGRKWLCKDAAAAEERPPVFLKDVEEDVNHEKELGYNSQVIIKRLISKSFNDLSPRCQYPARKFIKRFNENWDKLYIRITSPSFSVYSLYDVGKKTAPEMEQWLERVKSIIRDKKDVYVKGQAIVTDDIPYDTAEQEEVIYKLVEHNLKPADERRYKEITASLSKRSRNVVGSIVLKTGNDIMGLYQYLTDKHFSIETLKGIGVKSALEMYKWTEGIKEIIRPYYYSQKFHLTELVSIPEKYKDSFRIEGFLTDLTNAISQFRKEEDSIHIRDFIYPNCIGIYKEEQYAELETICLEIIHSNFSLVVSNNMISFPASV